MGTSKISDAQWQKHEPTIRRLYLDSDWTLDMVIREMSSSHGFSATQVSHHIYIFPTNMFLQQVTVHDEVQGLELEEELKQQILERSKRGLEKKASRRIRGDHLL